MTIERKTSKVVMCILLIIPVLVMLPVLMSDGVLSSSDGIGYEMQIEFVKMAIKEGEFPYWNKFVALGTSQIGDIQNKVFYPLTWLCALLPMHLAYKVFCTLHLILSMYFVFFFCKEIFNDDIVSLAGSLLVTFSNLVILRFEHINIFCNIVWIFFILLYLLKSIQNESWKYPILVGFGLTMQFFAGFPQTAFYSDIFVFAVYIAFLFWGKLSWRQWIKKGMVMLGVFIGLSAVQILPLIELTAWSGRNSIDYEYFSAYSADIRMILNMLSPTFLGSWCQVLNGSDWEFPTDTYIGIFPLILLVYVIICYLRKNKYLKFSFMYALCALIFACACRNFPLLGKVIYKVPVLGSFRVTTRMLVFFILPILFIIIWGLNKLVSEADYNRFLKVAIIFFAFYNVVVIGTKLLAYFGEFDTTIKENYLNSNDYFIKSYILLIICIAVTAIIDRLQIKKAYRKYGFLVCFSLITFIDINFFNVDRAVNSFRFTQLVKNPNHEKLFGIDVADDFLKEQDMGNYRYFVNYASWQDLAVTPWDIRVNGNIGNYLSTPQSYITFNNKSLLGYCASEYGMMLNNTNLMVTENLSFISMLSNKYIVQNKNNGIIDGVGKAYKTVSESYPFGSLDNNDMLELPILFDENEAYQVNLHINGQELEGSLFWINEKGERNEINHEWIDGDNFLSFYITMQTGKISLYWDNAENVLDVLGMRIEKVVDKVDGDIQLCYEGNEYCVYENKQAKEILYAPDRIYMLPDKNYLLENKRNIDFVEGSYIAQDHINVEEMVNAEIEIDIKEFGINSISANVKVNGEKGFINFSQSYYPGWKVIIDGKSSDSIEVNGIIQGTWIESGEHMVEFRYCPRVFYVGLMVAMIVFVYCIYIIFREFLKDRKELCR